MNSNPKQNLTNVKLGDNVRIFDFVNLYDCEIGDNSKVGTFVEIQKGARIGRNVKISSHSFICEGVTIEDDVFIGHNVSFINDKYPRATVDGQLQTEADWGCIPTLVQRGASIGTSATILCGVTIGENAIIGAGSVVTKDVPAHTIVTGVPARMVRRIGEREASGSGVTVPFLDLKAQYQSIKQEVDKNIEVDLCLIGGKGIHIDREPPPPRPTRKDEILELLEAIRSQVEKGEVTGLVCIIVDKEGKQDETAILDNDNEYELLGRVKAMSDNVSISIDSEFDDFDEEDLTP